jgi:hypothetical protein
MKQMISKQLDGDLNAQQFAVDLELIEAVQKTLYDYIEGFSNAEILEVQGN